MTEIAKCNICGEPMPQGETMFNYHGYSGPCPKPPMPKKPKKQKIPGLIWAVSVKGQRKVSMLFDTSAQAADFITSVDVDEQTNVDLSGSQSAIAQFESKEE